jgi:hypothetical protein
LQVGIDLVDSTQTLIAEDDHEDNKQTKAHAQVKRDLSRSKPRARIHKVRGSRPRFAARGVRLLHGWHVIRHG